MTNVTPTLFNDGKAYERSMGRWSRVVGAQFLDWLALSLGLRWVDVGCGNGAFTELLVERYAPAEVQAVDPSEGQLDFARERLASSVAEFRRGDAQALPFEDDQFDAAAMALAINLIPDRDKAVSEMARVTRPGGTVATYMWDINGGGFTMEPIRVALRQMGTETPFFGAEFTQQANMRNLWEAGGFEAVEVTRLDIEIAFDGFDDYWHSNTDSDGTIPKAIRTLSDAAVGELKDRLRDLLPIDAQGRIAYGAHANAVKGRVPG